ncbi:MAG: hypothetical protein HeimC3_32570 [Candidatus Heimdallarchaeota archaeon LC_3]|nr:MAG: hypothetical protein HeimC3_32570 [Candidatus Heimdallarchaeota archaeon LC_3]
MKSDIMSIFIDTGYFVSVVNKDDENHQRSKDLSKDILSGEYGIRYTSDYILDEAISLTWRQTKRKDLVTQVFQMFSGKEAIVNVLLILEKHIEPIWEKFLRYSTIQKPLSFTDCSTLILIEEKKIDHLQSFDEEFDGLVSKVS